MKINSIARPDTHRLEDDRQRDALAAGSFDDELDNARRRPDDLRADGTDERPRDPRDEREPADGPALTANPHDPSRPLDQRALSEAALEGGARAFGMATQNLARGNPLGAQASQLLAAQAALPDGAADIDQIRFSAAAEAASAGIDVASAEPAFDAFASVLAAFPGEDDEQDASDAAGESDGGAFEGRMEMRAPDAPKDARAHEPIRNDTQLATKIANAVNELAASSADRSDVVRFRTAAYTFAAVIRHDVGAPQVRLVSDDPNVRAFLGDRLPEVRQALERVGFASTGLSVAADSSSRHHERQPDQQRPDEDERGPERLGGVGTRRAPARASAPATDVDPGAAAITTDSRGLHLIV